MISDKDPGIMGWILRSLSFLRADRIVFIGGMVLLVTLGGCTTVKDFVEGTIGGGSGDTVPTGDSVSHAEALGYMVGGALLHEARKLVRGIFKGGKE